MTRLIHVTALLSALLLTACGDDSGPGWGAGEQGGLFGDRGATGGGFGDGAPEGGLGDRTPERQPATGDIVRPQVKRNVLAVGDAWHQETDPANARKLGMKLWQALTARRSWVSTVSSTYYSFYTCNGAQPCYTYGGYDQFKGQVVSHGIGYYVAAGSRTKYLAAAVTLEGEGLRMLGLIDANNIAISNRAPNGGGVFLMYFRAQ